MKSFWISTLCLMMGFQAQALDTTAKERTRFFVGMTAARPDLDVLFVVDNSGSMSNYQNNLAKSAVEIENTLVQEKRNYHLGVITADTEAPSYAGAPIPGELFGNPKVIAIGEKPGSLAANLRVGTSGSYLETPFDAIHMALSPDMLSKNNAGFIRPDARLAIVLLTDADDQSNVKQHQLLTQLEALKGGLENVTMLSWVIPSTVADPKDCVRDGDGLGPVKIEDMTRYLNGKIYNICEMSETSLKDFRETLASFGVSVQPSSLEIPLRENPDVATVLVKYGTQIIPRSATKGWDYDAAKNALIFSEKISWSSQPAGTELEISFYPVVP